MQYHKPTMKATSVSADESQPAAAIPIRAFVQDILIAFAVAVLPMLAFSALLLGLIFWDRVPTSTPVSDSLRSDSFPGDDGSIYVNLSGTTLTTVASWSSTMAPLALPFVMTVLSFPVARRMLRASRVNDDAGLPTPYQFSLMLRMVTNSSLGSIWHCMLYVGSWRGRRAKQTPLLLLMFCTLCAGILLSLLIFATDTWLHFAVKAVLLTQFEAANYVDGTFALRPECTNVKTSFTGGCTLNPAAANTFLMNPEQSLLLLANTSTAGTVRSYQANDGQYAYLAVAPSAANTDLDFTTTNWAIKTTCQPATRRCVDESQGYGRGNPYKCDFAMEGFLSSSQDNLAMVYFTDSTLTSNASNTSTTNIVKGTQSATRVGDSYLLKRASLDVWRAKTAREVADGFAMAYSQIALAVAGAAFVPAPAPTAQRRTQILVARVPVAPLVALVLANLLLVCFGLVMTVAAFFALRGDARSVGNVQVRLGIPPLVAAQFEQGRGEMAVKDVLDMFEERCGGQGPRVAIDQNAEGGWTLQA